MAQGLGRKRTTPAIVQAIQKRDVEGEDISLPMDAEEEYYMMEGKDPQVQYFNITPEMERKTSPNYSDFLRWREARKSRTEKSHDDVLDLLYEAFYT